MSHYGLEERRRVVRLPSGMTVRPRSLYTAAAHAYIPSLYSAHGQGPSVISEEGSRNFGAEIQAEDLAQQYEYDMTSPEMQQFQLSHLPLFERGPRHGPGNGYQSLPRMWYLNSRGLPTPFSGADTNERPDFGDTAIGAAVTSGGFISVVLQDKVRVDITMDQAIRVVNYNNNIILALSGTGSSSALLHPNGRVCQYGSRVEIRTNDQQNNKYAKMWYRGVSFTADQCALVYLVDSAGTRTTSDTFSDLSTDFAPMVFYSESRHGPSCVEECMAALQLSQYWVSDQGVANWIINSIRVSQTQDGLVRVCRQNQKYHLRTSPNNGTTSVTTPYVYCTASLGEHPHLFVRRGERRLHYDGTTFIVRNAGHSAGFDKNNRLTVY